MSIKRILVCGSNGIFGSKIVSEILKINANCHVRLLMRDKTRIHPMLKTVIINNEIDIFEADLLNKESLYGITDNIDAIISCVSPENSKVIIEGQTNLLDEIIRSGNIKNIKRFIPSEFGLNMVQCHEKEAFITNLNESIMCRLKFRDILTSKKYKDLNNIYTFINCGAFIEGIFGWLQLLNLKQQEFKYTGNGINNFVDITCTDDIAKWTATIIFDENAPKEICVIGETVNCYDIINLLNKIQNKVIIKPKSLGSFEQLKSSIYKLSKIKKKSKKNKMMLTFLCYQYLMFNKCGNFDYNDIEQSKKRYPNLRTTSMTQYLSNKTKAKSWIIDLNQESLYKWKQILVFPDKYMSKL